jgi:hypothetical protein
MAPAKSKHTSNNKKLRIYMKALALLLIFITCVNCSNSSTSNTNNSTSNNNYRDSLKTKLIVQQSSSVFFNVYNLDTLYSLINKDTSELKKLRFPENVYLSDTAFYAEDDSSWFCFACYNGTQILLIMETSLECPNIIQRIGVLNGSVVGLKPVHVGSIFKDIKPYVSQTIPSYPDGYFGLKDKAHANITYFFDIGDNNDLAIGNVKFETIPENITISQILIE